MATMHTEKDLLLPFSANPASKPSKYVLVIHGGAGRMTREGSTPAQQAAYHAGLEKALKAGYAVLSQGGEAMDAAVAAVTALEDNILFNAGKGAVFNTQGENELEASIMLSKPPTSHPTIPASRRGLGLTLLTHVKNPSQLARRMYLSPRDAPHTFMAAPYAEVVAQNLGQTLVEPSYFFSAARWKEHRRGLGLPDKPYPPGCGEGDDDEDTEPSGLMPKGTVGAVALDAHGCICAVTSTGGRTNKAPERIGDTPVMGSGYWAEEWKEEGWAARAWNAIVGRENKRAVGVSGTGEGDYFIRHNTASTIAHRVRYLGESIEDAALHAVQVLRKDDADGGIIALDSDGNVTTPLNCPSMYRGVIRPDGIPKTAIFNNEHL